MTPTDETDEVHQLLERASKIDGSVDIDRYWAAGRGRLSRRRAFGAAAVVAIPAATVVAFLTFGGEGPPSSVPDQPAAGGVTEEVPATGATSDSPPSTEGPGQSTEATSTGEPDQSSDGQEADVVEVDIDPYLIASGPSEYADWGSHVVYAEAVAEREVEPRYPMALSEGQTAREVDLQIRSVLWSHPDAVTPVEPGETVALEVSPGWVDGQPAVLAGTTRLEVGSTYIVTFVDTYDSGDQYLSYLLGSIERANEDDVAGLREELDSLKPDPSRGPRPEESWDARFIRGGGTGE